MNDSLRSIAIMNALVLLFVLAATAAKTPSIVLETVGRWAMIAADKTYKNLKGASWKEHRIFIDGDTLKVNGYDEIGNELDGLRVPLDSITTGPKGWKCRWTTVDTSYPEKTTQRWYHGVTFLKAKKNEWHVDAYVLYVATHDSTGKFINADAGWYDRYRMIRTK